MCQHPVPGSERHGLDFRPLTVTPSSDLQCRAITPTVVTVFENEELGGALLVPKPREAAEVAADRAAVPCAPGVERGVVAEMRL